MTVCLLFSSPHSFSTGFRSEDCMAIAEVCFCAHWSIFVLFLRFVFWLLSGWKIQIWPIIRFLTESVTYWFFFICWYLIESIMPRCPGPPAEMYAHNIKNTVVYFNVHMGYFLYLTMCSPNPSWVFAAKKLICLVTSDHRSQSHLKFQSCLITECAGDCFLVKAFSFLDFFLNMRCRCCLITSIKVFWPQNSSFFCNYLATQTLR